MNVMETCENCGPVRRVYLCDDGMPIFLCWICRFLPTLVRFYDRIKFSMRSRREANH